MSSTSHAISTTPTSIFKVVLDNALKDYTEKTGIDLAKYDFAQQIEGYNSPYEVLRLFGEKERQFKEHRERNRRLINWITPVVQVVHVLSGSLGEAINLVSCHTNDQFALLVNLKRFTRRDFLRQKQSLLGLMSSSSYVSSLLASTGPRLNIVY